MRCFNRCFNPFHSPSEFPWLTPGLLCPSLSLCPLHQWSPTLGLQMFLDFNSQKSWPAEIMVKASGSCSPKTSGGPRLGTTALRYWFPTLGHPGVLGLQLPEILASAANGEGFWEFSSKNIWGQKRKAGHCLKEAEHEGWVGVLFFTYSYSLSMPFWGAWDLLIKIAVVEEVCASIRDENKIKRSKK